MNITPFGRTSTAYPPYIVSSQEAEEHPSGSSQPFLDFRQWMDAMTKQLKKGEADMDALMEEFNQRHDECDHEDPLLTEKVKEFMKEIVKSEADANMQRKVKPTEAKPYKSKL